MKANRRSVFVILVFAILSIAPGSIFADIVQDCTKSCGDRKTSDDANCPGPDQGIDQGRTECLKNNEDIFKDCMQNCSPSAAPAATAPESATQQGTGSNDKIPQTSTPQGTTPQNQTPQTGTPYGTVTPQGLTPP